MGWRLAPPYTRYWNQCRKAYGRDTPEIGDLAGALGELRRDGVTTFRTAETTRVAESVFSRVRALAGDDGDWWDEDRAGVGARNYKRDIWKEFPEIEGLFRGALGCFIENYFGCTFKIFYGILFRSDHLEAGPAGSALWHADGGPGTCVNVIFYLHDTDADRGSLHALPWAETQRVFGRERAAMRRRRTAELDGSGKVVDPLASRELLCRYYEEMIEEEFSESVRDTAGPAGTVVPFLNNILHRGGYPVAGKDRTAIVFHCYPSDRPTDYERYAVNGIRKTGPYPADPAANF